MRPKICGNLDKNWPVNWSIGVPIVLIAEDKELAAYGIPRSPACHLDIPICTRHLYYKGVQIYATPSPGKSREFDAQLLDNAGRLLIG